MRTKVSLEWCAVCEKTTAHDWSYNLQELAACQSCRCVKHRPDLLQAKMGYGSDPGDRSLE